jgi:hypothetical protein
MQEKASNLNAAHAAARRDLRFERQQAASLQATNAAQESVLAVRNEWLDVLQNLVCRRRCHAVPADGTCTC